MLVVAELQPNYRQVGHFQILLQNWNIALYLFQRPKCIGMNLWRNSKGNPKNTFLIYVIRNSLLKTTTVKVLLLKGILSFRTFLADNFPFWRQMSTR